MNEDKLIQNALSLHKNENYDEAEEIYLNILKSNPLSFDANQLYACLLHAKKQYNSSRYHFEFAVKINNRSASLFNNFGNLFFELKEWESAKECFEKSINIDPQNPFAYNNIGTVYKELSQFDLSMSSFNKAIDLDKNYADAHWNRSILNLLLGNFQIGWREFEWRWSSPSVRRMAGSRSYNSIPYTGIQPLSGKNILIYHEQGFGDSIQFVRFAIKLSETANKVFLHVPDPLVSIFSNLANNIFAIPFQDNPDHFDYHCPMMSLPLITQHDKGIVPYPHGYLYPNNNYLEKWRHNGVIDPNRPNIGIVWSGNPGHTNDKYRSIDFSIIEHFVLSNPNINFISLHKDHRISDLERIHLIKNLFDVSQDIINFEDTLALCNLVDHVISVDTSVLHLACASGKSTSALLPKVPDWRWGLESDCSSWYDCLKIYRCLNIQDWNTVFKSISSDLKRFKY